VPPTIPRDHARLRRDQRSLPDVRPRGPREDREKRSSRAERRAARRRQIREKVRIAHLAAWFVEKVQGFDRGSSCSSFCTKGEQKKLEPTMGTVDCPQTPRFAPTVRRGSRALRCDGARRRSEGRAALDAGAPLIGRRVRRFSSNTTRSSSASREDRRAALDARSTMRAELERARLGTISSSINPSRREGHRSMPRTWRSSSRRCTAIERRSGTRWSGSARPAARRRRST